MLNKYTFWITSSDQRIKQKTEYQFETKSDEYDESFKEGGFVSKTDYLSPFYYVLPRHATSYIELYDWSKNTGESIVCLWNHNEHLFSFYCRDDKEKFDCVNSMMDLASKLLDAEYKMKSMQESVNED